MLIKHQVVTFDAADLAAESRFWAEVLGGVVEEDGDWHTVTVDKAPRVGVQHAPDHVPPQWPDGPVKQQMHLDLWVEDFAEAHEQVIALGATVLKAAEGNTSGGRFPGVRRPGRPSLLLVLAGRRAAQVIPQ